MIAAIAGLMMLMNRQAGGFLENYFSFLYPLPFVFYACRYGIKNSWIVFIAVIFLCVILGTPQSVFYVGAQSLIGLIYGDGIHRHRSRNIILGTTILLGILVSLLTSVVFASFFGFDIAGEVSAMKDSMDSMLSEMNVEFPAGQLEQILLEAYMVAAVMTGVLSAVVTHLLSLLVLKRMRVKIEPPRPLQDVRVPVWSGYIGLAGTFLYLFSFLMPARNEIVQMALNGIGMAGFIYLMFFGIVAAVVFIRMRRPAAGIGWILLAVFACIILYLIAAAAGFLYISGNLRRLLVEGAEPNEK